MDGWIVWLVVGVTLALLGGLAFLYNRLVGLRQRARNAWSDIDVQLKRRHDLVPPLVEIVKGYASHERTTLERVTEARQQAAAPGQLEPHVRAENMLTQALRGLFAVVEDYPDLKANHHFLQLQRDLAKIEDDVANARRYYNAVVRDFNTMIHQFPALLVAGPLGFRELPFFGARDGERAAPAVKLPD